MTKCMLRFNGKYPTIYSAQLPKLANYLGYFWKKPSSHVHLWTFSSNRPHVFFFSKPILFCCNGQNFDSIFTFLKSDVQSIYNSDQPDKAKMNPFYSWMRFWWRRLLFSCGLHKCLQWMSMSWHINQR
jgi:hypothetical protein